MTEQPPYRAVVVGDDHPNRGPHTECLTDHGGRGVPRHCRRGCHWPCPNESVPPPPHDGMSWEELLAHPALTFDPNAEVTALLLAPAPVLPSRPWLYDANATGTASHPPLSADSAQQASAPTDLATSTPDPAVDVAGTTGPTS